LRMSGNSSGDGFSPPLYFPLQEGIDHAARGPRSRAGVPKAPTGCTNCEISSYYPFSPPSSPPRSRPEDHACRAKLNLAVARFSGFGSRPRLGQRFVRPWDLKSGKRVTKPSSAGLPSW
jgi:hypothetical protein